jgi:hypothetical protein
MILRSPMDPMKGLGLPEIELWENCSSLFPSSVLFFSEPLSSIIVITV